MRAMEIKMDFKHIEKIDDLRKFITGSEKVIMKAVDIQEKYEVVNEIIGKFNYLSLSRKDKQLVLKALKIFTGYKKSQLHYVIDLALSGKLERQAYKRVNRHNKYTGYDIRLLEQTDEFHYRLSSAATHEILRREYEIFGKKEYANVSQVSCSHINNLRNTDAYRAKYLKHTQARVVPIGETRKPETNGKPGYIRIDSVSQNDIYIINSIDEVTQWEIVMAVPAISQAFLEPVLEQMLQAYPFLLINFHSDRGSEYINYVIAKLLERLHIHQTKSRSRQCNDQALVEGKNGTVVRKNFGYGHMNKQVIKQLNDFFINWFNPYLNYHRPCGYVTDTRIDHKGKEKKIYGQYTTPYEKLKEIVSNLSGTKILKKGISFEKLDSFAYEISDNEFAKIMRKKQYDCIDINNYLNTRFPLN